MNSEVDAGATDRTSRLLVAGMACGCLLACHRLGFTIDVPHALAPGLGVVLLIGVGLVARARGRPRLAGGAAAFLDMTLFTLIGVVLAYALAARAGPLWDGRLAAADARLGLDWPAIRRAADQSPLALGLGWLAYQSLILQMIVCIVALSATGRIRTLEIAVAAAILSGWVTIAISGLLPARGNLFDPAAYRHLWPSVAWQERGLIAGLRDGSVRVLDFSSLQGIVSFPSYHATLPVILAWAQREVRGLRVVAPIWAGVTILATPLFGGHYGVDVLAGIGLAIIAYAVISVIKDRRAPSPSAAGIGRSGVMSTSRSW